MKTTLLLLFLLASGAWGAESLPWIGVKLAPSSTEDVHQAGLRRGVGLSCFQVAPGSPLELAGGEKGDLWWKFDGQILINRSQMVVLLAGKKPGDTVNVELFRDGKPLALKVKLTTRNEDSAVPISTASQVQPEDRYFAVESKVAKVKIGAAEVSLKAEGAQWRFEVFENAAVQLSVLTTDQSLLQNLPPRWHGTFLILQQSLKASRTPSDGESRRRTRYIARDSGPKE